MKKIIIKKMPQSIINLLFRLKFSKEVKKIHLKNIQENKIISININDIEYKRILSNILNKMCKKTYTIKNKKLYFLPLAIIDVSKGYDNYLKLLNSNNRSKIKRAVKKNIICKEFDWNNYLDDIYEINTSSIIRQNRKMDSDYFKYPEKITYPENDEFTIKYIGAFYNEKLVGYIELYIYNHIAMTNRLLGHKEYLNRYIMNALFAFCVKFLEDNNIDYLNYLTMHNKEYSSLGKFKERIGFREYSLKVLK